MRLTIRTSLALRTLLACAANPDTTLRRAELSERLQASGHHLAQVIHQLGLTGYLDTQRGRNGGFRLARDASQINIGELFRVFEGSVPMTDCQSSEPTCPMRAMCRMQAHLKRATDAFYAALDSVTLAMLIEDNTEALAFLSMAEAPALSIPAASCRQ